MTPCGEHRGPPPAVYTMVKFGGVRNYIVGTWTKHDLEACADLNLPCADVSAFLPEPMDHSPDAGEFGSHDYLACGGDPLCASGCHVAARHVRAATRRCVHVWGKPRAGQAVNLHLGCWFGA